MSVLLDSIRNKVFNETGREYVYMHKSGYLTEVYGSDMIILDIDTNILEKMYLKLLYTKSNHYCSIRGVTHKVLWFGDPR